MLKKIVLAGILGGAARFARESVAHIATELEFVVHLVGFMLAGLVVAKIVRAV